ncbi:MraY family glycosyltransferase [Halobacteriovorax sp. HLS]|uniref:MraY family glycosyltransferase n=1 Tax=Halobacteriovorax sp. HLS TaxID=2234000 RepID=UPI0013E2914D|nr:MraY family glycosyltransferase [Halobacteriovorax sp. HLS]
MNHKILLIGTVLINLGLLFTVARSRSIKNTILRELFYIPARKSKTNAVVLGGLALSFSTLFVVYYFYSNSLMITLEKFSSLGFILSIFLVTIHGYLDDKFEISPRIKLLSQLFAVMTFSLFLVIILQREFIIFFIPIAVFWGFGTLNGSNLLDGLDTMTVKVSSVVFLTFYSIGFLYNIKNIILITPLLYIGICSFYFFNKEPAKIHLGEIGANLLGLTYIFLSSLIYINTFKEIGPSQAIFLSLLPLSIPMIELAVSFLRRLYFKKSPFKSDRLHIHHILTRERKYSASKAASATALIFLVPTLVCLFILQDNVVLTYFIHGFSSMGLYILVCYKYWKKDHDLEMQESIEVGKNLKSKNIKLISSKIVEDFEIIIDSEQKKD